MGLPAGIHERLRLSENNPSMLIAGCGQLIKEIGRNEAAETHDFRGFSGDSAGRKPGIHLPAEAALNRGDDPAGVEAGAGIHIGR
jgi:hypothetical protein